MYPIEDHIEEIGAGWLHMFLSAQQPCSVEIAPTTLPSRAAQFFHTSATSATHKYYRVHTEIQVVVVWLCGESRPQTTWSLTASDCATPPPREQPYLTLGEVRLEQGIS